LKLAEPQMRLLMWGAPFVPRAIPYALHQLWLRGCKIGAVNLKKKKQNSILFMEGMGFKFLHFLRKLWINYLLSRVIDLKME